MNEKTELRDLRDEFAAEVAAHVDERIAAALPDNPQGIDALRETQSAAASASRLRDRQQWEALEAEREQLAAAAHAAVASSDDENDQDEGDGEPQRVDVLQLAVEVATDAYRDLYAKPVAGRRLEHKIALAAALADIASSVIERTQLAMQQQGFAMAVQQHHAQQQKSPSGIVVPHLVPNGN